MRKRRKAELNHGSTTLNNPPIKLRRLSSASYNSECLPNEDTDIVELTYAKRTRKTQLGEKHPTRKTKNGFEQLSNVLPQDRSYGQVELTTDEKELLIKHDIHMKQHVSPDNQDRANTVPDAAFIKTDSQANDCPFIVSRVVENDESNIEMLDKEQEIKNELLAEDVNEFNKIHHTQIERSQRPERSDRRRVQNEHAISKTNRNIYKTKYRRKLFCDKRLQRALIAVGNGMSSTLAADKFNVPRNKMLLAIRKLKQNAKTNLRNALTKVEEESLVDWINVSVRRGFKINKDDVLKSVNEYLNKKHINDTEKWLKLFLNRHPTLDIRTQNVNNGDSAVTDDEIKIWFREIEKYFTENDYFHILSNPARIYNSDIANFVVCPEAGLVLNMKDDNSVLNTCSTVILTVCADGNSTPPMVIFPYDRFYNEITPDMPDDWGVGVNDSGLMNSDTFYDYVKNILHPYLVQTGKQFPIVLFVDGQNSYLTYALSKLCTDLRIILIALPRSYAKPMKPEGDAALKPLKTEWPRTLVAWRKQNPSKELQMADFVPLLQSTIEKNLKPKTIINAFRAAGLCPWNKRAITYKNLGLKLKILRKNPQDLSKDDFIEIVGRNNIDIIEKELLSKDEANIYLKLIWTFFKAPISTEHNTLDFEPEIKEEVEIKKEPERKRESSVILKSVKEDIINNMKIIFNDSLKR